MRITNGMLARGTLSGLQRQMKALDEVSRQVSTGIRVNRPSDDPVAAAGVMRSSSGLEALTQYRRNVQAGQSRLTVEDSTLDQLGNALSRAKELGLAQASGTSSTATRLATKAEVDQLVDFAKDLANTQHAGSYLYGGQYADRAPYGGGVVDPAAPPTGQRRLEVGSGRFVNTNHSAQEIFVDTDAVASLEALSDALAADDTAAIQASLTRLDDAFAATQEVVGDLGARMSQLDVTLSNLEALEVNLQTFRSELSDADLATAVTELVNRQGTLEAAMMANSRILNLTMTNYLR